MRAPRPRAASSTAATSSTTRPKCRCSLRGSTSCSNNAMNWSPRSMNAMPRDRLRSRRSGKSACQKSSASSTLPTSSATWLMPSARAMNRTNVVPGALFRACLRSPDPQLQAEALLARGEDADERAALDVDDADEDAVGGREPVGPDGLPLVLAEHLH